MCRRVEMKAIECCCRPGGSAHLEFESQVLGGWCPRRRVVEPAGHGFQRLLDERRGVNEDEMYSSSDESDVGEVVTEGRSRQKKSRRARQALQASKLTEILRRSTTLYEVLELAAGSPVEDIKSSHRRMVLSCHPDKLKTTSEVEKAAAKEKFLFVQEAFEILSNAAMKKQYDSGLPFAPEIPATPPKSDELFYQQFGDSFKEWNRFSDVLPCPVFGDGESTIDKVRSFYAFYANFCCTREYSQHDEFDLADAHEKHERRWMEGENIQHRAKAARDDMKRLAELCSTAMRYDPRIVMDNHRRKEETERLRRQREEKQRNDMIARATEDQRQRDAFHQQKNAEAERMEAARIAAGLEVGKREAVIVELAASIADRFPDLMEDVRSALERRRDLKSHDLVKLHSKDEPFWKSWLVEQSCWAAAQAEKRAAAKRERENKPSKVSGGKEWTDEDTQKLTSALNKYPGSTIGRWKVIQEIIPKFSEKEIIAKTQGMKDGRNRKGVVGPAAGKSITPEIAPAPWSGEQIATLQKGLRKYSADLPPKERWAGIASLLPGKKPSDCLAKVKELRAKISTT